MATSSRPTLGVLAGWQFYWTASPLSYLNPLFHGLRAAAQARACNLLFACGIGSADPQATETVRPAWPFPAADADFVPVGPWNTDGLIVINPLLNPARSAEIAQLRAQGFPVLFVGSGEVGPTLMADNAIGTNQALQHLVAHGHRQIAFIAGTPEDAGGDTGERLRAYQAAVHELGLADDARLRVYGRHVYQGGYQAMQSILATGAPFTAVLASNDESALGAMQALRETGRTIPGDVALIGFDDRPESALQDPPLTTVQIPLYNMGYQAGELLCQFLAEGRVPPGPFKVPTRLVVRQSCGCAPTPPRPARATSDWPAEVQRLQRAQQQLEVEQQALQRNVGRLTANLLAALDETHVLAALTRHLPELQVRQAALVWFDAAAPTLTPQSWGAAQLLTTARTERLRLQHQHFPPVALCPRTEPFQLAVIPLANQRGPLGYMAFDAAHLNLYGAIVQQVAAALHSAQLYQEAMTGRRLAEEANRLKSRFLSTVSHELRAPLNIIVGLSELLLQEKGPAAPALPDEYRKDIERIQASGQHLGWLIRDVLDLASNEAGQLRLTSEFLALQDILQVPLEIGQQLAQDKGLAWHVSLPTARVWVWGDRTRLRQVVLNLVQNAVKFTAQGEVQVALVAQAGWAVVQVRDTGLGIPLAEQQVVFEEFRRTEAARAQGYGGLGLGLAICKLLVELHGGTITAESTGIEGEGTMFTFRLPLVEGAQINAPVPPEAQAVLVLAQRATRGEELLTQLQTRGLPATALWLDENPDWLPAVLGVAPGVVVLDVGLPPALGWEVFRVLKSHPLTQDVPVLFFTLTDQQSNALELDYLVKPLGPAEIGRALQQQGLVAEAAAPKTVLVVDDDPTTRELHTRLVQTRLAACRVLTARDGHAALALLAHEHPDLVLLDLSMPGLDGFGVLEAMRQTPHTRDIPVVVITGQSLTESEMARLNRGVTTVLEKELFSVDETLNHVEAALLRRRKLGSETQRLVRRVMAYIHEHYAEPLTREDLARHVGMSDDYLTASFRKELGMTPVAYITRCRINQAKTLLKTTSQSVTDIGLAVGFSDSSYFSRVFRRETGQAPEAWRRG